MKFIDSLLYNFDANACHVCILLYNKIISCSLHNIDNDCSCWWVCCFAIVAVAGWLAGELTFILPFYAISFDYYGFFSAIGGAPFVGWRKVVEIVRFLSRSVSRSLSLSSLDGNYSFYNYILQVISKWIIAF